jgi:hypothetical protein
MGENKYDPGVDKRLELVRKQFQRSAADQKKQEAADRRGRFWQGLRQNRIRLGRWITYTILAILVLAVIGVVVWASLSR